MAWGARGITHVELATQATESAAEVENRLCARVGGSGTGRGRDRGEEPPPHVTAAIARMRAHLDGSSARKGTARERPAVAATVREHLDGRAEAFEGVVLELDALPPFHQRVYAALQRIPVGTTVTYAELAALAGSPGASRAVGQAMAKNPVPILVPCHRVLAAGGKAGGFSASGGVELKARLLELEGVKLATGALLPLDFEPDAAAEELARGDPKLGRIIAAAGPFRLAKPPTRDTFGALMRSIVYQQLNGKAAATILARVQALHPGGMTPAVVQATSDAELRSAGLSAGKTRALRDLAEKTLDGTVPPLAKLRRMNDEEIVEALTAVRGIGRWTVEMLLMFRLGRPDVLPVGDFGVRKGVELTYRLRAMPAEKDVQKRGEAWRPWRSVASWYMWRAVDLSRAGRLPGR